MDGYGAFYSKDGYGARIYFARTQYYATMTQTHYRSLHSNLQSSVS